MNKKATKGTPNTFECITRGLVKLIEGQKYFAEEFGLNFSRIFPNVEAELQVDDLTHLVRTWLNGESQDAEANLEELFAALIKHQLALMAALDGVALHTLQELTPALNKKINLNSLLSKSPKTTLQDYKNNYQLRYQKLIAPGFVSTYMKVRQELF